MSPFFKLSVPVTAVLVGEAAKRQEHTVHIPQLAYIALKNVVVSCSSWWGTILIKVLSFV